MKNLKPRDLFLNSFNDTRDLNEMAKDWPVGTIAKFAARFDEPPYNERCSKAYNRRDWSQWTPSQAPGIQGGSFYMKITESGKLWLVGKILYTNGISEYTTDYVRIKTKWAAKPTSEFEVFEKYETEIANHINKSYYIDGSENGIMSNDGKDKTDAREAEYTIRSMNFKLTDLFDEPVFFLVPKGSSSVDQGISMKLSSLDNLQKELSVEQREVIAEWFGKQLKADIELVGETFKISKFMISSSSNSSKGFKTGFQAGPFINMAQAESALETIKKSSVEIFDTSDLRVYAPSGYGSTVDFNLDEIMNLAKSNGIEVSMKKLLELKKGAVAGKKFGLG